MVATLSQVELLTPHYSHREAQPHPTDSEIMRYLRSMRLLRSYELNEDELSDLWSDVEKFQKAKADLLSMARPKTDQEKALDADRQAVDSGYERRFALQEVRTEQGAFRASLMSLYKSRCVISGCSVVDVLQAAHIVPFSESVAYRNDVSNGLILRSDIHTLFDRFLISIRPVDGTVFLAGQLLTSGYRNYHGKRLTLKASPAFLGDHFKRFREVRAAEADLDAAADF
jgi:predicted restriction endonuclease